MIISIIATIKYLIALWTRYNEYKEQHCFDFVSAGGACTQVCACFIAYSNVKCQHKKYQWKNIIPSIIRKKNSMQIYLV